jgi:hypothetical protein
VQSNLAEVIRNVFALLMLSFYPGLIGPRALGQGGVVEGCLGIG